MLRVDDANRGKMARCPKCNMINSIPASGSEGDIEPTSSSTEPPATTYYLPPDERWTMRGVDGTVYGPVSLDELRRWFDEGRINYQCSVQRVGDADWQPALDVLGPQSKQPSYSFTEPTTPAYVSGQYAPHNGTLILVLAIVGIFGVFPCALLAAILGHNELKRIKQGIVDPSGESTVRAGYALGIVFSILWIVPMCCCCSWTWFDPRNMRF